MSALITTLHPWSKSIVLEDWYEEWSNSPWINNEPISAYLGISRAKTPTVTESYQQQ